MRQIALRRQNAARMLCGKAFWMLVKALREVSAMGMRPLLALILTENNACQEMRNSAREAGQLPEKDTGIFNSSTMYRDIRPRDQHASSSPGESTLHLARRLG